MIELFHLITDEDSAAARRLVVARGLESQVRFRNLAYTEVRADFDARGGTTIPALWMAGTWVNGRDAVLAQLDALAGRARPED